MKIASEAAGLKELKAKHASKSIRTEWRRPKSLLCLLVLCLEPKTRKGLSAKWQGPYEIKKQVGIATYILNVGHGQTKHRHCNALKPYLPE